MDDKRPMNPSGSIDDLNIYISRKSILDSRNITNHCLYGSMVKRLTSNEEIPGSIPCGGIEFFLYFFFFYPFFWKTSWCLDWTGMVCRKQRRGGMNE